jgi:hypothetical protein
MKNGVKRFVLPSVLLISVLALLATFFGAKSTSATTYYVAANGSDSNDGTSKTTPWQHAPGMSTATGVASSATINPGDSLIFRGGDTWHFGNSALAPFAGYKNGAWSFTSSGTFADCNLNASAGPIATTSCIYIGVDQTWFSGSSWARPQFNMDNPITNTSPTSCLFEDSNFTLLNFSGQYLIIDNFEILGYCWNKTNLFDSVVSIGTNDEIKNSYWHGWSMGATATGCGSCDSDEYWAIGGNAIGSWPNYVRIDHNIFDGSDSTYGNLPVAPGNATGGIFLTGGEIDHNVLNHCSNGMKYYATILIHDNFFENMSEPIAGGTHGNVMEWSPTNYTVSTYYYNNVVRETNEGETIDMYPGAASSSKYGYIFNNVMTGPNANPTNCYMVEGDAAGGAGLTQVFNNTNDSPCIIRSLRGSSTGVYQNNHLIGFLGFSGEGGFAGMTTNTNNGNEILQSESAANAQGYVRGNDYAPTLGNNATVGKGANLTSLCNGMDNNVAMSACKLGIAGVTYITLNHTAVDIAPSARPANGPWDVGAYQYSGNSASKPVPPTGLQVIVQ